MSSDNNHLYEFGSFQLNPTESLLLQNGQPVRIPPKTLELLLFFIKRSNQIIDKETIMREVWHSTFVEDANLTVHISTIRKILAKDPEKSVSIETYPRRGYRFVGDIRSVSIGNGNLAEEVTVSENQTTSEIQTQTDNQNIQPGEGVSYRETVEKKTIQDLQNDSSFSSHQATDSQKKSPDANQRDKNRLTVFAAVILIAVLASAFALYKAFNRRSPFQEMKITRILDTGKTRQVSVSPDGKYIAQVISDEGKQSLWLKHLTSNSNVQLIAPDAVSYSPLTFSNDGSYIYFVSNPKNGSKGTLFQIPVLGGEPKKILDNAGGEISFAPDGERFVFTKNVSPDETALVIANINGHEERQLIVRRKPESFGSSPAWSPDDKTIAFSHGTSAGDRASVISIISVEDGTERQLSARKWRAVGRLAWLNDGSGLIGPTIDLTGLESGQLWLFPFPSGEPQRITNDLHSYGGTSLTADSKTLVTIQDDIRRNIWLVPDGDSNQARSLTDNAPDAYRFVTWTPDKRIIYPSLLSGNRDLWIMNADGSNQRQLTATPHNDILPAVCQEGQFVVFASNRDSRGTVNIWRMNIDGTNLIQLTHGSDEVLPNCTPDGKWVIYVSGGNDSPPEKRTIWKVPIEGGEPVQITSNPSFYPHISPDGKQIACWYKQDKTASWKVAIIPIEGGEPTTFLDAAPNSQLRWLPHGNAITYIKNENSISNIWSQPISGGPPQQLTKFTNEQIWNFDWSSDNQLICSRGITTTSAILISNFR